MTSCAANAKPEAGANTGAARRRGGVVVRRGPCASTWWPPRRARRASPAATLAAHAHALHRDGTDTTHADRRVRVARGRRRGRVAAALVARAAERAAGHGAAGVAGRGLHHAGARRRLRGAGAPRHGVRLRGGGQRVRLRARVRRAHEPGRDAGRAAVQQDRRAAGAGLRGGADAGRAGRVRRAAGHDAGGRGGGAGGLHAAGAARVGRGRRAAGGGADGRAGAGVLRRVERARRRAPRPRRAHQARPRRRRPRLRRGARDGRQPQPGAQLRARAAARTLGLSVGKNQHNTYVPTHLYLSILKY